MEKIFWVRSEDYDGKIDDGLKEVNSFLEQGWKVKMIVADAAYKTPHICKKVFEDKRILSTAYKRPQTMKGGHEWWEYVYDEYYDCIICPEYQILHYSTTNRDGYREYKSDPKICAQCPTRELCTRSKDCVKTVQRHIWKDYEELADDARYTPKYRDLYKRRKETIERVFADAKEKHAMRYTQYRGLAQVANWVKLKFVAMNLKKFAKWKCKESYNLLHFLLAYFLDARNPVYRSTVGRVSRQTETRSSGSGLNERVERAGDCASCGMRFFYENWLIPGTDTGNQKEISRPAGRDSGLCPENLQAFRERLERKL